MENDQNSVDVPYECKDCDSAFQDASEFYSHECDNQKGKIRKKRGTKNKAESVGRFKCDICQKYFRHKRYLPTHMLTHNETCDFICDVCHKAFKNKRRLQLHYQIHTARYACDVCGKGFGERSNLRKHQLIHTGIKPFVCSVCNKGFTQNRHLKDHMPIHSNDFNHACDICGKKFVTRDSLKNHTHAHSKELRFKCSDCGAAFAQNSCLQKHLLTHCENLQCYCNYCGQEFQGHAELKEHLVSHTGEHPYLCEICQKPFSKYSLLRMHQESHSEERPFECNICFKSFKTPYYLKKHSYLHTGERSKQCKTCGKIFKSNNSLWNHLSTHSEVRPFSCDICQKTFKRKTALQNHLPIHTGELAHECEICKKRFARKSTLENHFLLHTGAKPYICPICKRSFSRKSSLKIHSVTHSKEAGTPEEVISDSNAASEYLLQGDVNRHIILAAHNFLTESELINRQSIIGKRNVIADCLESICADNQQLNTKRDSNASSIDLNNLYSKSKKADDTLSKLLLESGANTNSDLCKSDKPDNQQLSAERDSNASSIDLNNLYSKSKEAEDILSKLLLKSSANAYSDLCKSDKPDNQQFSAERDSNASSIDLNNLYSKSKEAEDTLSKLLLENGANTNSVLCNSDKLGKTQDPFKAIHEDMVNKSIEAASAISENRDFKSSEGDEINNTVSKLVPDSVGLSVPQLLNFAEQNKNSDSFKVISEYLIKNLNSNI